MFLTPVCDSVNGGHAWLLWGGMHGCSTRGGVCDYEGGMRGCSRGVCMVAWGGMCGCSGGVCMVAWGEACMVALGGHMWLLQGGVHGCSGGRGVHGCLGGHAWDKTRYGDTVNERAVGILLECILVSLVISFMLNKIRKHLKNFTQ